MQIVSNGDKLHVLSNSVVGIKKKEKESYHQSSAEFAQKGVKVKVGQYINSVQITQLYLLFLRLY